MEAPLAPITTLSLLGFICISFTYLVLGIFPHSSLQTCSSSQVEWGTSVNSNLQVFPQILNGFQVWALAGPLEDSHVLVLKPFQCCFGCMLGVHVLLECKSSPESEVFCSLKPVLLMGLPLFGSIHCSPYPYKSPSPCH